MDAKNLNDQTYISTTLPIPDAGGTDGNYFYSGEGRAFYAGVRWEF
jgi:iron complex outermembrane receptor protein